MVTRSSLPPFAMLRAFESFGRTGGVRKAALDLDVDHAVVSRHLRALEAYVGTALIERATGSDKWLTENGRAYHAKISVAFQIVRDATEGLKRSNDSRLLISCSPGLSYHWLMPLLPIFGSRYPQFELSLRPTDKAVDFASNDVDGDIRYVRKWETISAKAEVRVIELASPPIFPVASPEYLATIEPITTVADLLKHKLLHEENDDEWRAWFSEHGVMVNGDLPGARLWHAHVSLDAALKGQGIGLSNEYLLGDALASGKLTIVKPVMGAIAPIKLGRYVLIVREDRWRIPPVARFREWLLEKFEVQTA